jgi:hypothetical protein
MTRFSNTFQSLDLHELPIGALILARQGVSLVSSGSVSLMTAFRIWITRGGIIRLCGKKVPPFHSVSWWLCYAWPSRRGFCRDFGGWTVFAISLSGDRRAEHEQRG